MAMRHNPIMLWKPSQQQADASAMKQFMSYINQQFSKNLETYPALYQWSITDSNSFWLSVFNFCNIQTSTLPTQALVSANNPWDCTWFPHVQLNFAKNLLKRKDEHIALIFTSERGDWKSISYKELWQTVCTLANYFQTLGIQAGDRIIGILPNIPEAVIAALATAMIGAVWSSCSPDFGLDGLYERFSQINPRLLIATDGHTYKGKMFDNLLKLSKLQQKLPSLVQTIIIPYLNLGLGKLTRSVLYSQCFNSPSCQPNSKTLTFPFDHPLYILYSSGTTGKPKCLVHSAGGTLVQHAKELILHTDLKPEDRLFFYTTCSWMMWNWLVSGLVAGATLILYDGSPFHPHPQVLFELIEQAKITVFGTSAKWIESCAQLQLFPKNIHNFTTLRTILTTGSPLLPEHFDYIQQAIKTDLQISSIAGGSDIISCFALGNPLLPVYRGQLQCIGLGMSVKIFNERGQSVIGEKGELVCTAPFPSMPVYLWNDPEKILYKKTYFHPLPGVWTHGDYACITPEGGMIIYGRSDTTLNPRGIRIGTSEIYQQVKKIPEVVDCMVIGQKWKNDERIILFVVLQNSADLTPQLQNRIKQKISEALSSYYVPAKIIAVPDIPRTRNGKIAELAVKNIIHQEAVKNKESLDNPETLSFFENLKELELP